MAGTALEVVDALRNNHAQAAVVDRVSEIGATASRFQKRQRRLVAEEMWTILANLAEPGMDGHALTEEIRNLLPDPRSRAGTPASSRG